MKKKNKEASMKETLILYGRAFGLLHRQCPGMVWAALLTCITSSLTPYINIFLSAKIINELAGARNPEVLWRLVLITVFSNAVFALLRELTESWENYTNATFWFRVEKIYADKLLSMDFSALDEPHTHELYSQIDQNQQWQGKGLMEVWNIFRKLMNSAVKIAGAVALTVTFFTSKIPESAGKLLLFNHPLFLIAVLVLMLLAIFLSAQCHNRAESYWAKSSELVKFGNRVFGAFGFNGYERDRALDMRIYEQQNISGNYLNKNKTFTPDSPMGEVMRGPIGLFHALGAAVSNIFTGMVYLFVCIKAWAGAFGVGSVTQYIGAITALSGGVSEFLTALGDMQNNEPFLRTTYEFLDIPNQMYQGSLTTEKRADRSYEVEFRDVSFRYPNTQTYALRHVSMKFKIGERLAIVGRNGSGKTTFIKLLCRLYDPTEGEILLNGIDIRKYNYEDYMGIFSVVFQDFKLLAFSLGQNVAAGRSYEEERVRECLEKAGFSERLEKMPKGVQTCLYKDFDKTGVEVSGGEAQKIAIARTLYKDAPFIVLDEPTAALDPIAEEEIYRKFNEITGDKTAIYISHRLSSCRFCDEIAVFDNGAVVQQGNHDALLKQEDGIYRELWEAQAQYYTISAENQAAAQQTFDFT